MFPALAACPTECRSNWQIYVEEFARALARPGGRHGSNRQPAEAMTPFERKYGASGHALWRCVSEAAG